LEGFKRKNQKGFVLECIMMKQIVEDGRIYYSSKINPDIGWAPRAEQAIEFGKVRQIDRLIGQLRRVDDTCVGGMLEPPTEDIPRSGDC
jgi:hypothetical protein